MNPITSFLARYKGIRPPTEVVAQRVSAAIQSELGILIDASTIRIVRKTAFVSGSSAFKSELALKRSAVLSKVQAEGGGVDEIR